MIKIPEQGGVDRTLIQPQMPNFNLIPPILPGLSEAGMADAKFNHLEQMLNEIMEYLRQQQQALAFSYDLLSQVVNEHPEMIWLPFFQDNVSASQSAVALSDGRSTRGYCAAEDGSVTAIAIKSNAGRSGGTLTVEPAINGTAVGLTAVLDATNTTTHDSLQDQGTDIFSRGSAITCKITTDGSWAPTTADIIVSVGVVAARGVR